MLSFAFVAFVFVLAAVLFPTTVVVARNDMFVGKLEDFKQSNMNNNKIALHFSCEESNMFSTNCACHIKCKDSRCSNAIDLCKQYHREKCNYVFLRGGGKNRFATLKRDISVSEAARFNISEFENPKTMTMTTTTRKRRSLMFRDYMAEPGMSALFKELQTRSQSKQPARCGFQSGNNNNNIINDSFLSQGITLFTLSFQAPITLANSMRSWSESGLLDAVARRVAILNQPTVAEVAMAKYFGFEVVQPKDLPNCKMAKPNVLTIGSAFHEALKLSNTEYILFLENDFKIDTSLSKATIMSELLVGASLLRGGVEVVRLQSKKGQGCGTFKSCDHGGIHLDADSSDQSHDRLRNWFSFYCKDSRPDAEPHVDDCLTTTTTTTTTATTTTINEENIGMRQKKLRKQPQQQQQQQRDGGGSDASSLLFPEYRCFTSRDSNWSLNAAMVKKSTMLHTKYVTPNGNWSIGEVAVRRPTEQDAFEADMVFDMAWMQWRVPLCLSYRGLFLHEEIETSA